MSDVSLQPALNERGEEVVYVKFYETECPFPLNCSCGGTHRQPPLTQYSIVNAALSMQGRSPKYDIRDEAELKLVQ